VRCGAVRWPPFFGELGINPVAEPALVLPPSKPLGDEDLVDATPLDRDLPVLVEIIPEPVEGPASEREAELLRVGQRDGDDLGTLLGGVGVWASGAMPLLQPLDAMLIEPADPGIDGGPGTAQVGRDLTGGLARGGGLDDPCPIDQASGCGACSGEIGDGELFLGGHLTENDFSSHGCTSLRVTSIDSCKSLAGCTI
jgi:hypothetical protein